MNGRSCCGGALVLDHARDCSAKRHADLKNDEIARRAYDAAAKYTGDCTLAAAAARGALVAFGAQRAREIITEELADLRSLGGDMARAADRVAARLAERGL